MAYVDDLLLAYKNANGGVDASTANKLAIDAWATQANNGGITQAAALANTLALLNSTTAVVAATYQFFTGVAPSEAGLTYFLNSTANANDLNDASGLYSGFNQESRFINFSINLAIGSGSSASFAAAYTGVTYQQTVATAYDKIIGNTVAAAAGVDVAGAVAWLSRQANIDALTSFVKANNPTFTATQIDLAVKAALIGEILNIAVSNNLGAYANAVAAYVKDYSDDGHVTGGSAAGGVDLFATYPGNIVGQTYALTASVDTLVGTGGADTFNAVTVGGVNTLTALDKIDGGAGADTLNIVDAVTATTAAFSIPAGVSITNIETVNLTTTGYLNVDASTIVGLTKFVATSAANSGNTNQVQVGDDVDVTVSTASGNTYVYGGKTATVSGNGYIELDSDTLVTATVTSHGDDVQIYSESLTTLTVTGADSVYINNSGEATVTTLNATNVGGNIEIYNTDDTVDRAVTFNLTNYTGNYVEDDSATSVALNVTGKDASVFELDIDNAATLTVGGTGAVEIDSLFGSSLETITVTNTAGVTIDDVLGVDVKFTGGAGADSIVVGATTQVIDMGAGNDTVRFTAAPATGGNVSGGAGTDTIELSGALATSLTATTAFAAKIDGFEKLSLDTTGNETVTVNLANLDNINYVVLNGDTSAGAPEVDTVTFGALSAGQSVTVAGRTITATTALTDAQVAAAFYDGTGTGFTASGTVTGFSTSGLLGNQVALTSTVAGPVTNAASSAGLAVAAPLSPSVSTTNGTGTTTEVADVTFSSLANGQKVTIDGVTYTANGDTTAAQVAAFFAGATFTNWVVTGSGTTDVVFTSKTANTDVTNIAVSTAGTAAATAPGVVESMAAVTGSAVTLNNLGANSTLELTAGIAGTITANLKDATGAADVINLVLNGTSNISNGTTGKVIVAGVETVNITTTDSDADNNPTAAAKPNLVAADATKIVVTGNHGVDFTGSTLTKVVSLDASGVVGTGSTASVAATAGAVTFVSTATGASMSILTGNGNDLIDLRSQVSTTKASTISTGAGNDTVYGTSGADTIDLGAGNDTVHSTAGADKITLGAGNDTYILENVAHSVVASSQTLTDFSANTKSVSTTDTSAIVSVTARTGDVIDLANVLTHVGGTAVAGTAGGVVTGISVQTFANAADAQTFIQNTFQTGTTAAAALDSSTGKLYLDVNHDGNIDSVITLTGVTTLTAAAFVLNHAI